MSGNLVESLIGALVLVVAGGFLYLVYATTDVGAVGDGYELEARFEQVSGLSLGSDVRISGIKVGTVVDQTLDPETYQAVVRIKVNSSVKLPTDTSALVASEGVLGGNYLALQPGGMPDMLQPGDQIEFTQDAIDLMSLIGQYIFSGEGEGDGDDAAAEPGQ